jgi:hypothetical protein
VIEELLRAFALQAVTILEKVVPNEIFVYLLIFFSFRFQCLSLFQWVPNPQSQWEREPHLTKLLNHQEGLGEQGDETSQYQ